MSRTVLSYSLIVWLLVQIADVVFPMIGLPEWALRLVLAMGLLGLPLIVFLSWTYQITPHGIEIDAGLEDRPEEAADEGAMARTLETTINIALLVLGLALTSLMLANYALATRDVAGGPHPVREVARDGSLSVAVGFKPSTNDAENIAFVRAITAEVRHRLIELPNVKVVADDATWIGSAAHQPHLVLSGSVYYVDRRLRALVHVLGVAEQTYLWTAVFDLEDTTFLDAEASAAERVAAMVEQKLAAMVEQRLVAVSGQE